ncbi:hypothetical protein V496_01967 [Pseudogymnoascus sp. VKM F-4515 (FW-2607)]|nr:hypothetical protein V496_01967 [Pseudogymnoascus sp. VKM F-4515 (FW-2607)]
MSSQSNDNFLLSEVFNVKGRVALVTGGGSGIGLMATQALAVNGAKVYIVGRTGEKLDKVVEAHGQKIAGEIIPITADITLKSDIAKLVKEIESREKCLCILINNAGISGNTLETEAKTAEEMKKNLFDAENSTFDDWCNKHIPYQRPATVLYDDGFPPTTPEVVRAPPRIFRNQVANNGLKVRINSIAPGVFPSEMTAGESGTDQKSHIDKEKYQKLPAKRPGKDQDMAGAILFAAANQYLNGQTVAVDGGYLLHAGA